jgi:uncharacterized membrane protein YedE/YeeE
MQASPTLHAPPVRPFWSPLAAGVVLGLVLLLTFVLTGHGLGATGFTTRLTAVLGGHAARANAYLGPLLEDAHPLASWITWQVLGVALGALFAAWRGGRLRLQVDGPRNGSRPTRLAAALVGGVASGFGARVSAGCTSGLGLSGAATLGLAAFVFLGAFFAAGLLTNRLLKGAQ